MASAVARQGREGRIGIYHRSLVPLPVQQCYAGALLRAVREHRAFSSAAGDLRVHRCEVPRRLVARLTDVRSKRKEQHICTLAESPKLPLLFLPNAQILFVAVRL